jgi:hypothetical protein
MSPQYLIPTEPPRPGLRDTEARVLAVIRGRRGRDNAISRAELSEATGLPDRTVRRHKERLVKLFGYPVCASYEAKRGGYYWPVTDEEIQRVRRKLRGHALSILVSDSRLGKISKRMRNLLEQLRLEIR